MNRSIRKVAVFVSLMFAALMLNITYNSLVRTPSLLEDPRNRRVRDAEYAQDRGAILVGDTPIAITNPSKGTLFKYQRSYAQGPLYAHVTGYYSYDFASSGLEKSYSAALAGTDSSQAFVRFLDILSGRKPTGANLLTTIDSRAQRAAAQALGDRRGAVIAMNYTTGQIIAMYSSPSFDPNLLATHDLKAEQANWAKLLEAPGNPLRNKASSEIYLPGSTFKLITAAAALESGLKPTSLVDSPDKLSLPGTTHQITNAGSCGGAQVSIHDALVVSCNTAFANLGMTLGPDALRAQAEKFGFGKPIDSDIPNVASTFPKAPDQAQTAMSAIGLFDVAASPLQMLLVTAAIANNGTMMRPYLVNNVTQPDLTILSSNRPTVLARPISSTTAQALQDMMREVVTGGTGRSAGSEAVRIYGKTGTAMQDSSKPNYAWMVAFAKDPDVAVVAMIQDADSQRSDISGGRLAGPVVRQVIESVR